MKTVDYVLDSIAACDLKVSIYVYIQLIECIKVCDYLMTRSFLDLGPKPISYGHLNLAFSQKSLDHVKPKCV